VVSVAPAPATEKAARGFLLLRRGGGLWGVASGAVRGLARRGGAYRIETAGGALAADEVLGVVADLAVRPLPLVVRRFWPEPAGGWAVVGGEPVVVVDPGLPPRTLRAPEDPAADHGRDEHA
jgi:hypothetical protein